MSYTKITSLEVASVQLYSICKTVTNLICSQLNKTAIPQKTQRYEHLQNTTNDEEYQNLMSGKQLKEDIRTTCEIGKGCWSYTERDIDRQKHRYSLANNTELGVGAKSTMGIRNFNLLRSQVTRRKRVV
jgi:hypothetical protein